MPNIFQMLEADHREVLAGLEQISGDSSGHLDAPGRRLLLDRLIAAESRHEAAEELVFWPLVRRRIGGGGGSGGGAGLAEQGRRQEGDARYVLDALRYEQEGTQLADQIEAAAQMIRSHIAFEEEQVWPPLRRALGPVGSRLAGAKLKAALTATPTRPHPHGPEKPLGLATVGAAAAFGDRLRDRLGGRAGRLDGTAASAGGSRESLDATAFLAEEHERMDGMLRQVGSILDRGGDPGDDLVGPLVRDLSIHDAIEREHLYPLIRQRLQRGNDLYRAALEEHGEIAVVLTEIDRRPPHDQLRRDSLKRLTSLVRTHVAEEEGTLFAGLRSHLSEQEMAELGATLRAARDHAPTRPHPHLAGAGMGTRLSRMLAGPLDRARDSISGRR